MKMEPIEGSKTSTIINQTPGNYPKGNLLRMKMSLRLLDIHQRKGLPGVSTTHKSKPYILLISLKNLQADSSLIIVNI